MKEKGGYVRISRITEALLLVMDEMSILTKTGKGL